ncbi:MAG: CDP-alcohol phosphatidyltransferase family protein [Pseudomonadota bacterium]
METNNTRTTDETVFWDWITYPISWWALFFVLPFLYLMVEPLRRNPRIQPNHITIVSFIVGVCAALFILVDRGPCYIIAGILFACAYLLDCADGMVARMNRKASSLGALLDNVLDRWKIVAMTCALLWVTLSLHQDAVTAMLIMVNFCLYSMAIGTVYEVRDALGSAAEPTIVDVPGRDKAGFAGRWMVGQGGLMSRWMALCYRFGLKPSLSEVEADMAVFCVGMILTGLCGPQWLRPCLLISIAIYVFSVHAGYVFVLYKFFTRTNSG